MVRRALTTKRAPEVKMASRGQKDGKRLRWRGMAKRDRNIERSREGAEWSAGRRVVRKPSGQEVL